ncbi:MAG: phosphoribosylglycinamide formyltransferase [Erysipelotrichaceae bacterium]|nr:phosphoribosylglycinamide formyltransferase [Erysipelotrichaceae bacterium]MDD3809167.1 phosphoribosylglycinamide formyltransferase [Erysipelotrichaceae bacterium]
MVNIAVLVSGSGSNLQSLIDHQKTHDFDGEIKLVVANKKSAYGLVRAAENNIANYYVRNDDHRLLELLKEYKIDLVVLAGYLSVISDEVLEEYENKMINIHPSLIPSFCGPGFYGHHVHDAAYARGVHYSGATVHFVSKVVDGGPIIMQEVVSVKDVKNADEIGERVLKVEHAILPKAVELYCDNKLEVKEGRVIIK